MYSSYNISQYYVSSSFHSLVAKTISSLPSRVERRFFLHILASSLASSKLKDPWFAGLELPSETINRLFGYRFAPLALEKAGLIETTPYSTALHRCRAYRVEDKLFDQLLDALDQPTKQLSQEKIINLIDGKPAAVRRSYQASPGFSSKFLRDAASCFRICPFDGGALDAHLAKLRKRAEADNSGALWLHWKNDVVCANRMRVGSTPKGDGVYEYRPAYRPVYTGRVAEVGGGLQSCSRAMKFAALSTIPDVHNYDLRSAQAFALLQELEDAGLEDDWLAAFLASPTAFDELAAALDVPRDVAKECFYPVVFGALFTTLAHPSKNKLYGKLLEHTGDKTAAMQKLVRLHRELRPLETIRDRWHDWLVDSDDCPHLDANRRGRWLLNDCGMTLRLDKIEKRERRRRAAAFILQGREAAHVHHLTLLAEKYGFVPISNQHDGLVTIGVVPEAAHEEAKALSEFRYATLEEKPTFGAPLQQAA